jgi:RHS repeat-associated protein
MRYNLGKCSVLVMLLVLFFAHSKVYATSYLQKDSTCYKHAQLISSPGDSVLYVRDSTYFIPGDCGRQIRHASLRAFYYMGDPYKFGSKPFNTTVNIRVRAYSTFVGLSGLIDEYFVKLDLSQDVPEQLFSRDFTSNYNAINRFVIHIMSYTGPGTTALQDSVHLGISIQESLAMDVNAASAYITSFATSGSNPVVFSWTSYCPKVPNYQLQLLRLYNTNPSDTTETTIAANVDWNQAMSVEVGSNALSLTLSLTEGQGYYIWRVRPIGNFYPGGIADSRNYGPWSITTTGPQSSISGAGSGIFYYKQFDDQKNWIYSRTFSEGDPAAPKVRVSEKMTYANGLQQVKQSQSHIQSLHQILINQTIYDWSGRAALVTLPAPVNHDTLGYQNGFAKANGTTLYSQSHFDDDTSYFNPKAMGNCFLAGYYSDTISDKLIPNAEGYPYSRALYERDGTARVKEQGGPGNTHRIDSLATSHTTKTYYSGVSDEELILVLGDEAPAAFSVHKVINIDANQTASVTYMSKEGQAIITCLAIGANSTILDTLPSQYGSRLQLVDTVKGNAPLGNYGITSSKPLTFAIPTTVAVKYGISSQNVQQLCMSYCKNCDYTIEFIIRGDNHTIRKTHLITAANCTTPKPGFDTTFSVTLAAGSYVFEKRVYANNYRPSSISDSTGSQKYLDYHLANLRKSLQDTADARLSAAYGYLKTSNRSGFYTYLGTNTAPGSAINFNVTNPDSVYADSSRVFSVKCNSIKIPILTCSSYDCSGGTPDFEGYFNKRWAGTSYVGTTSGYLNYFPLDTANGNPGYKPGEFNTVIANMLLESGAHAYTCSNLWGCWDRLVQSYGSLHAFADTTPAFKMNLLKEFLDCAGTQYIGYKWKNADEAYWKYKPYEYFFYSKGRKPSCDTSITHEFGAEPYAQDSLHGLATGQKYLSYRDCEMFNKIISPVTPTVKTSAADAACGCESACDAKLESFKQSLIRLYHNDSIYVEGDRYKLKRDALWGQAYGFSTDTLTSLPGAPTYYRTMANIECAARSLVDNIKKSCVLTTFVHAGTGAIDSVGTKAQIAAMGQVMNSGYELQLPSCGSGWTSIKPISSGDHSYVPLWQNHYGAGAQLNNDNLNSIVEVKGGCGGYLLGGTTNYVAGYDVSQGQRGAGTTPDYWLIKVNQEGTKEWDRRLGGNSEDYATSVTQTSDAGFLVGGYSNSGISGEKSDSSRYGSYDYWVVKLDAVGNIVWNKTYGGNGKDVLNSLTETSDGFYLLGGYSNSNIEGEKTQDTIGGYDYWVVKVNATTGAKVWDKRYGTKSNDVLTSVRETKDKNYLLAGYTSGTNGTGSYMAQSSRGGIDYWIIKVNTNGDTLWNKRFGGSSDDYLYAMEPIQAAGDSSFILAGGSNSPLSGDKSHGTFGNFDYWVMKVNQSGTKMWDSLYGGSNQDGQNGLCIKETSKKGFFILGSSNSLINTGNKTDTLYNTSLDYWCVRIDSVGRKNWDRSFGGTVGDYSSAVSIDSNGDYWIAGTSESTNDGNKTSTAYYYGLGSSDYWVLRGRDYCTHDSICFRWKTPAVIPDSVKTFYNPISCDSISCQIIYNSIVSQVGLYIQSQLDSFATNYMNTCAVSSNIKDTLTLTYQLGYHHYTLYYYDRAGNLVRTVPPEGVQYYYHYGPPPGPGPGPPGGGVTPPCWPPPCTTIPIDTSNRLGTTNHTLKTLYKYNSLKQLIRQQTPDGGISNFWYDSKGELRFSQNAKQLVAGNYSYTKYDNLGRIIEVGQSTDSISVFSTQAVLDKSTFPGSGNSQRTYTVYTIPANVVYLNMKGQTFLQNRVSYTYNDDGAYTYYSYDPHGNVVWMIQDMPGLGKNYIRYEYDLVSNKVLKVHYNEGAADEFHHAYAYDADQRILSAQTSRDQYVWDTDAKYSYFKHGPLRRAEIGDDKIQGIDYVYTIQGWIKGINYVSTKTADDPGGDGGGNGFARDVFGMVIGYEAGDFNRTGSLYNPSNARLMSSQAGGTDLYNGNISSITFKKDSVQSTSIQIDSAMGYQYRYDQLNRIKNENFSYYSRQAAAWKTTTDFDSHYTYDGNGNLDTLIRNGYAKVNVNMDQFKYHYNSGTNQLNYVTDAVTAGNYPNDIDNESSNNYLYDAIGNLTSDVAGNISNIDWTVYGKVKSVKKSNGDSIKFVYDASGNRIMKLFKKSGGNDSITYYVRDAQGNVMSVYSRSTAGLKYTQTEVPLYGSSRIGELKPNILIRSGSPVVGGCSTCPIYQWTVNPSTQNGYFKRVIGQKYYELNDHLGNLRAIVSDRKRSSNTDSTLAYMNYYAFGMEMPNKQYSVGSYRYGFNGKESDNETYNASGTEYDYGMRIYNPRLGRFLSVDPIAKKYPELTPYQFASNTPIKCIDLDGLEATDPKSYLNGAATAAQGISNSFDQAVNSFSNAMKAMGNWLATDKNWNGNDNANWLQGHTEWKPYGHTNDSKTRKADKFELKLLNLDQSEVNRLAGIFGDNSRDPSNSNTVSVKFDISELTKVYGIAGLEAKLTDKVYKKTTEIVENAGDGKYRIYNRGSNDPSEIIGGKALYTKEEIAESYKGIGVVDDAKKFFKQEDDIAKAHDTLEKISDEKKP